MDEQEESAILLNKVIQDYILNTFKNTQNLNNFNKVFQEFYDMLDQKAEMITQIWDPEWEESAIIEYDTKQDPQRPEPIKCNPHKRVTMRYSLNYYVDIMTHIMLLIDEKVLINNPVLIERIKRILKNLI